MLKSKPIKLILIFFAVIIMIAIYFLKIKRNFHSFTLPKEPDGIFCSPESNKLAVIYDGELFLYDEKGEKEKIETAVRVLSVAYGQKNALVLDENNKLYELEFENFKMSDVILTDVTSYSCDGNSYGAVTKDGKLYMWGDNEYGQLGISDTNYAETPTLIDYINDADKILTYNCYSLLTAKNGKLFECGLVDFEQFTKPINSCLFTVIPELESVNNVYIGYDRLAVYNHNDIIYWSWGFNSKVISNEIKKDEVITADCIRLKLNDFSFGGRFCLAKNESGEVYYWGQDIINVNKGKAALTVWEPERIFGIKGADAIYAGGFVAYVKKGLKIIVIQDKRKL